MIAFLPLYPPLNCCCDAATTQETMKSMKLKTKIVYQRYFVNASASFAIVLTSYDLSFSFIGPCYRFDLNIRSKVRCDGLRPKGRSVRLPMPRHRPSFDLDSLFSAVFLQRNVSKKNRYFPYIIIIYFTSRYIHLYHLSRI